MTSVKIAEQCGVHPSFVIYIVNRCLGGNDDCHPALTAGIVPSAVIKKAVRSIPLSDNRDTGSRGCFQSILEENPDIKESLDQSILDFIRRSRKAENLTPGRFHREFLRLLREKNWPLTQYPIDRYGCTRL